MMANQLDLADDRLVVDVRTAARMLGISHRHLWTLSAPRGDLPVVRIGSRTMYDPADLRRWIESHKLTPTATMAAENER